LEVLVQQALARLHRNNPRRHARLGLAEGPPPRACGSCSPAHSAIASFPLEGWIMRKVSDGFRVSISNAIIAGDGLGKPFGFLNPNAGIPILDTSPSTPAGQFTWQDLVQLKWDVPVQWHGEGSYFMNQCTWSLLATMSDAIGRPLWTQLPGGAPGFVLNGSPV